ncbi:MAG: site-specific integrase [Bacteroidetes bacterium]|nr:site-specific integrase [Bacteroidota bacterium]
MKLPLLSHPEINDDLLKNKGVSIRAFCDTVRKRKDGSCTIRIRIIHERFPKYYSTKIKLSVEEFLKMCGEKPRGDLREKKVIIYSLMKKAYDIVLGMPKFTFEEFDSHFTGGRGSDKQNVYQWYKVKIHELSENGQVGTVTTYQYSMESLKDFTKKEELSFDQITPKFLERYERWMASKGKSPTTVGIYLRPLRHIFNQALRDKSKFLYPDQYPFNDYKIPSPKNIKKALSKEEVKKIFEYEPETNSPEHLYRDIWLFSYLCNGINMKDICRLRYENISGDHIIFKRAKTARTNKDSKPIEIIITEYVKPIIDRWGTKSTNPKSFIFPFLTNDLTPLQEQAKIKQATKQCNKYIKRIARKLDINKSISTYAARHSYASTMRRAGISPSFIGESMGHTSTKTTDAYFASFEDQQRRENVKKLTDWD